MLRIWSWNVNGRHLWDRLVANEVDVALLQEAPAPSGLREDRVVPHPATDWGTAGSWRWQRTAVVAVSETIRLEPRSLTSIEEGAPGALLVSRRGTLAAADVVVDGERITLVSMYAAWEGSRAGPIYADASAHRLLSDLSGIVSDARSHRIIAAGDLNILHRYAEYGDAYWAARYATVFDRAEAMGLQFVGPQAPCGRQAEPRPAELPESSRDVPTYHTWQQGPMGATRQLDFVFASHALADRLTVSALNADPRNGDRATIAAWQLNCDPDAASAFVAADNLYFTIVTGVSTRARITLDCLEQSAIGEADQSFQHLIIRRSHRPCASWSSRRRAQATTGWSASSAQSTS